VVPQGVELDLGGKGTHEPDHDRDGRDHRPPAVLVVDRRAPQPTGSVARVVTSANDLGGPDGQRDGHAALDHGRPIQVRHGQRQRQI
jgi:hypothetical protein